MTLRVAITGGAGFIGTMLARQLLSGPLALAGRPPAEVSELILVDLVEPPVEIMSDPRVRTVVGDLDSVIGAMGNPHAIFHLAGVVSGAAERDFDLGMHTNVDGTRALLEHARSSAATPVIVFSSSLAVFGNPAVGRIDVVDDHTLPRPQSSYGIQKFIGEQLITDYTRKGFIDGRSVRLMTVSVRPGKPNAAASSFLSGIIREPLAGVRAECPVPPDMPIALSSPYNGDRKPGLSPMFGRDPAGSVTDGAGRTRLDPHQIGRVRRGEGSSRSLPDYVLGALMQILVGRSTSPPPDVLTGPLRPE